MPLEYLNSPHLFLLSLAKVELNNHAGKTVVVIGHRATRYGLAYWSGHLSLEEIVATPWEWLTVPIWRYEFNADQLRRPLTIYSSRNH